MQFITRLSLIITLALTVSVCGAEPSVQTSRYYGIHGATISSFEFVYYKSEMNSNLSEETGFNDFGTYLMNNAKEVFSTYGINVTGVRVSKDRMPFTYIVRPDGDEAAANNKILLIYADSSNVSSNSKTTQVDYKFDVRLLDPIRRRSNWIASVNASTQIENDRTIKNKNSALLDKKYAIQFLQRVAEKMKTDGLFSSKK
ncbi:MAG: hypothetical protein OEL79_01390 [Chromatiales bacterium]|nr:hypothetical protein [Chromatiales bacterium]